MNTHILVCIWFGDLNSDSMHVLVCLEEGLSVCGSEAYSWTEQGLELRGVHGEMEGLMDERGID